MEEEIVKELMKECNFREKIIIKIFRKLFIKAYGIGSKNSFNNLNLYI